MKHEQVQLAMVVTEDPLPKVFTDWRNRQLNDDLLKSVILYLETGDLPDDSKICNKLLKWSEFNFLVDGVLCCVGLDPKSSMS